MPTAALHSYFWLDQEEPPPPPPAFNIYKRVPKKRGWPALRFLSDAYPPLPPFTDEYEGVRFDDEA